jgi:apolipoprotein N-acyltransferase
MKRLALAYGPAVLSGVLLALTFPRMHLFPLAWIALVPMLWRTWKAGAREAAAQFFLCGFVFYLVLLQWLLANEYWAGGWAVWGYAGLSTVMALYWAVTGALWIATRGTLSAAPALAVFWIAMEFLQSVLFTGFGWGALGYAQGADLPLAQWASVGGVSLLSGFLVLVNAWIAQGIVERPTRVYAIAGAVVVVVATHAGGAWMLDEADPHTKPYAVALVQPNFPLEMKWDPEYTVEMVRNTAEKSRLLLRERPADLLVWPESLVMDDIERPGIIDEGQAVVKETGVMLFTGTHRTDPADGSNLNSSALVSPAGEIVDRYEKLHLAPFGEYVPLGSYLPFVKKVVPAIGNIKPGTEPKVMQAGSKRFGPLICFEVLFPSMAERLRRDGADFLVVITNLGWFGASPAIPQELEIARMRAIETRLPLVHCANTGITGVFDPFGRFTPADIAFQGDATGYVRPEFPVTARVNHRMGGVFSVPSAVPRAGWPAAVSYGALVLSLAAGARGLLRLRRAGV